MDRSFCDSWSDEYSWEKCCVGREDYGKFIASILTSDDEGKVINLNGSWGVGKTDFLRRLCVELYNSNHPVVYIDAWTSDFLKDPLALVCSEILIQLESLVQKQRQKHHVEDDKLSLLQEATSKLESYFGLVLRYTSPALSTYALVSGDNTVTEDVCEMKTLVGQVNTAASAYPSSTVENVNKEIIENLKLTQRQLVENMERVRSQITDISSVLHNVYDLNIPIVILIDELDRCRPTYAVKMLEVIKHFFNVKGCSFIVATDTCSLHSSIKSVYGIDFDASRYLKRFFSQQIKLPLPSFDSYLLSNGFSIDKFRNDAFKVFPLSLDDENACIVLGRLLSSFSSATLRDVQTIVDRIYACLNYLSKHNVKNSSYVNVVVLMVAIVEQHFGFDSFECRRNDGFVDFVADNHDSLSSYIGYHLSCVSTTRTNEVYEDLQSNSWREYPRSQEVLHIQNGSFDLGFCETILGISSRDIRDDLLEQVGMYKNNREEYLMWDDYYSLVGLSKCIEL